ncbi:hypothetical protein CCMA1212_001033 [Trichoderma ghanense]|uniref:Uncharacterized protein n=1 Tax=Trichoderma ghanense TaxID=65468 RepID=A0ABY2HIQ7_9HYPO
MLCYATSQLLTGLDCYGAPVAFFIKTPSIPAALSCPSSSSSLFFPIRHLVPAQRLVFLPTNFLSSLVSNKLSLVIAASPLLLLLLLSLLLHRLLVSQPIRGTTIISSTRLGLV